MKKEFVKCEFCNMSTPTEACNLAAYRTKLDGCEYVLCCRKSAEKQKGEGIGK